MPKTTTNWSRQDLARIAEGDDLHVAPRRPNGETGTPTWIWSVAVDGVLYVRPYRGARSSWYQSARATRGGVIESGGTTYEVRFQHVDDEELLASVDDAYRRKYDGNSYLASMLADDPRATTVAVTPAS